MTKIDRRIKKSQKSIWDAFISLLLDEGFDQITVKAITEKADICRIRSLVQHFTSASREGIQS